MTLWLMLISLRSSLRRRYLYFFRRDYVEKMLSVRQGSCEGCGGVCCARVRSCPFLEEGRCSLYTNGIPFFCQLFPVDWKDIELSAVSDVCQYSWPEPGMDPSAENQDGS
ncbi:MAG: hypothetical protein H6R29_385 [Methanomicrobia archaeon]|nr:hypothetical protein [Methanomicrobia archaeon]